jgi:hypothetical protein
MTPDCDGQFLAIEAPAVQISMELDVVIKDDRVIVVEIKSALDRGITSLFDRKVPFYTRKTGR